MFCGDPGQLVSLVCQPGELQCQDSLGRLCQGEGNLVRAVSWEAEVDGTERLRPSRLGTIMSTALGVDGKEDALSRAAARPLLPLSPLRFINCWV